MLSVLVASVIIGSMGAPTFLDARKKVASIEDQSAQIRETVEMLKMEKATHAKKTANVMVNEQPDGSPKHAYTEGEIAYWRKQMNAFGALAGLNMRIVGRGKSDYMDAIRLEVEITARPGATLLTNRQVAASLDFLQAYGYVESFNGRVVMLHVAQPSTSEKEGGMS